MFKELLDVDLLLQDCHDMFLIRDAGQFKFEEILFAKLIFVFRSPATLIRRTRKKLE